MAQTHPLPAHPTRNPSQNHAGPRPNPRYPSRVCTPPFISPNLIPSAHPYLEQVVAALSELPRWGGGVSHGDPVVAKQLNQDDQRDNFLVYAVASELMKAAQHKYEMRAIWGLKDCTACESHAFDDEDANGAAAM